MSEKELVSLTHWSAEGETERDREIEGGVPIRQIRKQKCLALLSKELTSWTPLRIREVK